MGSLTNSTILRDLLFNVKDFLISNITDPSSSTRPSNEQFVMTSYPTRPVTYPIITIKDINVETSPQLGFRSEAMAFIMTMELRIWADNVIDRDTIAQEVWNDMRDNRTASNGWEDLDMHDFQILSSVNVDEPDGPKSKVIQIKFLYIAE